MRNKYSDSGPSCLTLTSIEIFQCFILTFSFIIYFIISSVPICSILFYKRHLSTGFYIDHVLPHHGFSLFLGILHDFSYSLTWALHTNDSEVETSNFSF